MNHIFLRKICLSITVLVSLSSCVPAIFTGAAVSTYTLSKDQTGTQSVKDIAISSSIKASLMKSNFRNLYAKITVSVANGRVIYIGKVPNESDVKEAIKIAWEHEGVKEVINHLEVTENCRIDVTEYTKDTFITTQIKSKLLTYKEIKYVNYNIFTYEGTVYIFGQARSIDELEKVAEICSTIKGVKKVVEHVSMLDIINH